MAGALANNGIPESGRPEMYRPRGRSSAFATHAAAAQAAANANNAGRQEEQEAKEVQNARAVQVLTRVKEKLIGRDFKKDEELDVDEQVDKLIREATNLENLCQHYIGWCSFW